MVPALGRQRQSQQMVPKKPSSSLPEILRGRLLRDTQEQIPKCPLSHPHWGCECSTFRDSSAWCQKNAAPLGAEHLSLVCRSPACAQPVIPASGCAGCSLEPQSASPGCVLLVPMPSSLVSQRSQTESAMETFPQQQPGDPSTVHTCQSSSWLCLG